MGAVAPTSRHVRRQIALRHDPAVPVPALGRGERLLRLRPEPGVFVNGEPGVAAVVDARRDAGQACHRAGRTRRPQTVDRQGLPLFDRRRGSAPGFFPATSATSRINASSSPSSSTPRRNASASSQTAPAFRLRRGAGLSAWPAFLFPGRSAAIPPCTPRPGRGRLRRPRRAVRRPASAARHRFDRLGPRLQRDDGFGHTTGIPGILRRPAFQALPGRIAQMPHHLGRGHRRGEIQLHRALPFLGTGHTKNLSLSLQENVRSPMSYLHCANCTSADLAISPCTIPLYKYDTNRTFSTISSRSMHRELGRYGVRVSALRCAEVCTHNLLAFVDTACNSAMLALRQGGESNH
ncbi:Hypothetical protein RY69_2217 [Bifidobacterium breve]|nr:Hypothetical protein RY69_2217 [Bifidobacterium breve]